MNKTAIIKKVAEHVKKQFEGESSGHDWWHILRVWKMAKVIQKKEGGDLFVVELGALLHDIADWKFNDDEKAGSKTIKKLLEDLKVDQATIEHVGDIIDNISFKGAEEKNKIKTLEGKIVQDADRIDALGAIGIARVFAFGGKMGRKIYDPSAKPRLYKSSKEYKIRETSDINHFYEKLLLLKDRLNTKTAKKIAEKRHKFLENYLTQFFKEWNSKI